ncbi:MAG: VWA domain-containing protein, partial [Gammaproteobacteria bacterium]|nr:VWA domain-containing protein [Gammaproteobacteria bacterium]
IMEIQFSFLAVSLNNPEYIIFVIPIIGLLLWQINRKTDEHVIRYSGLKYYLKSGLVPSRNKQKIRLLLITMLILTAGVIFTFPELRSSKPLLIGPTEELRPVYLFALDVSGSMTEPLGGYVIDGQLNINGPTRYEASEGEIIEFAENHPDSHLGLILFSIQPMLVRWPTIQTEFDFHDVLDEGMRFTNPLRNRTSQLAQFAGGTATLAGLKMSRETLINQRSTTRSLILIGDLIDNIDEVIEGIYDLHEHNIYVHVIALDAPEDSLGMFTSIFEDQDNVRIYPVKSAVELDEAFDRMAVIENQRLVRGGGLNYVQDMQWLVSLIGFFIAASMMVLFETRLHKSHY